MTKRQNISSGTPWEALAGYSRAVRVGDQVFVAGTTASNQQGEIVGKGSPAAQTRYIFEKIERALNQAGANLKDVVRTRVYITDMSRWEEVAREHGRTFENIRPANTLLEVSALVTEDHLVEIEAFAIIGAGDEL